MYQSMGQAERHPRVLMQLADETANPLSIVFARSWESSEVSSD